MRIEVKRAIGADPTSVFAVLADLEHWPEWEESFVEVALQSGQARTTGARYRCKRKMPQIVESTFVLRSFEPGSRVEIEGDWIGSFKPAGGYAVKASDGGSEVTSFATPQLRGAGVLMTPLLAVFGRRLSRRYLDNLARVVERGTSPTRH